MWIHSWWVCKLVTLESPFFYHLPLHLYKSGPEPLFSTTTYLHMYCVHPQWTHLYMYTHKIPLCRHRLHYYGRWLGLHTHQRLNKGERNGYLWQNARTLDRETMFIIHPYDRVTVLMEMTWSWLKVNGNLWKHDFKMLTGVHVVRLDDVSGNAVIVVKSVRKANIRDTMLSVYIRCCLLIEKHFANAHTYVFGMEIKWS